jgi:hypothetical protein
MSQQKKNMLSLTDTPGGNAHKHTVVLKQLRKLITEGLDYTRMKCSEREYFNSSAKMEPRHTKLPLKREKVCEQRLLVRLSENCLAHGPELFIFLGLRVPCSAGVKNK